MKFITALASLVAITLGVLWFQGHTNQQDLASRFNELESSHDQVVAERNGLRDANAALRTQLDTLRNQPLSITNITRTTVAPALAVIPGQQMEDPESGRDPVQELASRQDPAPRPTRTPEEEAAREQRQQEWQQRRQEMQARLSAAAQDRKSFFQQVPTEGLAPEYLASHQRLVQALDEIDILMARRNDESLSSEDRRAARGQMFDLMHEVQELMGTEREILLSDYATGLGLQGQDTDQFIEYMQTINEMTTAPRMFGGRGGGRGDGPQSGGDGR